jgi:hypothetical protein
LHHANRIRVHTALVDSVCVHAARAAGLALVLATLVGCSRGPGPEITTVTFDGETHTIDGHVACVRQLDGGLLINAPVPPPTGGSVPYGGKRLIRVDLLEEPRLVVQAAGVRFDDVRGFTDNPDEMWATKADNVYTINGNMADDNGIDWHQFKIEVTCPYVGKVFVTPPRVVMRTSGAQNNARR